MTKALVEDGDKSNATLHILIVRPRPGLHCTLTLTCNPHLSSAFDLRHNMSRVFRGQKARHRQRKCKAGELFSRYSSAPLIQYILTFFFFFLHVFFFSPLAPFLGEKCQQDFGVFNVGRHSHCYRRMNESSSSR